MVGLPLTKFVKKLKILQLFPLKHLSSFNSYALSKHSYGYLNSYGSLLLSHPYSRAYFFATPIAMKSKLVVVAFFYPGRIHFIYQPCIIEITFSYNF